MGKKPFKGQCELCDGMDKLILKDFKSGKLPIEAKLLFSLIDIEFRIDEVKALQQPVKELLTSSSNNLLKTAELAKLSARIEIFKKLLIDDVRLLKKEGQKYIKGMSLEDLNSSSDSSDSSFDEDSWTTPGLI